MARLKIFCFGTFQAFIGDTPLIFDTDKARALLVYLALQTAHPQHRQHLAGLLWSDMPEERALHNLRQTLSMLRKTFQDDVNSIPFLLIQRDSVQFNPANEVWLDTLAFEQGIEMALRHYRHYPEGNGFNYRLNPHQLKQAVKLFRGPFLDQLYLSGSPLFDDWASLTREELNQRAIEALTILTELSERRGEYAQARQYANQIVALAPWDETTQARIIHLLAVEGQWSAAQTQYRQLQSYLRAQMGVEPAPETEKLLTAIRQAAAQNMPLPPRQEPVRYLLPHRMRPFVGRESELEALAATLADPHCRLLTLHGPGGVGKTSLAIRAAEEQRGIFRDGVFFIPLDSVTQSDLIPTALSEALQFTFFGTDPLEEQLLRLVEEKHMLWVLDNLEQLLPLQPGSLIPQILQHAPGITILATSRQRLNLHEEYLFPVEGLSYPQNADTNDLEQQEAIQLFVSRSQRVQPHFHLKAEVDRRAVVEICQLVEGLPLGVELAAAALWAQNPSEIAANLRENLHNLASESLNTDERHRSLSAAFKASWALLSRHEQQLLTHLSVYRGGFEAEMVQQTLAGSTALLDDLIDKSLLRRLPTGRYAMHEAIRQFAAEKLALDADQSTAALKAHAQHFTRFLQTRVNPLKSAGQLVALVEITREWENIRQAWRWLVAEKHFTALADCAEAIFHFCTIRTRYREGIDLYAQAISTLEDHPEIQARLLTYQGALAFRVQENDLCETALNRALEIFAVHHAPNDQALCLIYASGLAFRRKKAALARQNCEQSLALYEQTGDSWGKSYALYQLGLLESRAGHVDESRQAFQASLQIARIIGDQRRQIGPLNLLGDLACKLGEYTDAQAYFEAALALSRILDDRFNIAQALINLGTAFHYAENYDLARAYYEESLSISHEIGDLANHSLALINLGELTLATHQFVESIAYLQQAQAVAEKAGDEWAVLICWIGLCETAVAQGDIQASRQYLKKTIPLAGQSGEPALLLRTLLQLGRLYLLQAQNERAVSLLGLVIHHEATYDEHRQAAREALTQAGLEIPLSAEVSLQKVVETKIDGELLN